MLSKLNAFFIKLNIQKIFNRQGNLRRFLPVIIYYSRLWLSLEKKKKKFCERIQIKIKSFNLLWQHN